MTTNPQAQAAGHAASAQRCPLCGENEPFTGTCGGGRDNPRALCYQGAAQAAAPAVGVNLRNAYARDLEDTLNQIADALGVERGKPEALITAALAASTPSPQPAQPAQAEDAERRFSRTGTNLYDDTGPVDDVLIRIDGNFRDYAERERYAAWVLAALNDAARQAQQPGGEG